IGPPAGRLRAIVPARGRFLTELNMPGICRRWGLAAMVGLALVPAWPVRAAGNAPSGRYAELPSVKLWFTASHGAAAPVELMHANTGTSATWEAQATAFAREGYRVVAFDRRGWGKSVADPATGPQPRSVAADLDALANHLKLAKFHLVGVAGGGFVSLDYAA